MIKSVIVHDRVSCVHFIACSLVFHSQQKTNLIKIIPVFIKRFLIQIFLDKKAVSIFKQFWAAEHGYGSNLEELGQYYQLYKKMMRHWHSVFPDRIYDLHYHDLVHQPEQQTRQLLDYCKLPFDSACLNFYKTQRAVNTPSTMQVREPISTKSIDYWKNYQAHLNPLVEALE